MDRRLIIKRIGVLSFANLLGALYAVIGLIAGGFISLAALIARPENMPVGLGMASVIMFPLVYGLGGLIGGFLVAALYNLISPLVGGIELDVES
jgi:hypothetical protein